LRYQFLWWQPCRLRRRHACHYRIAVAELARELFNALLPFAAVHSNTVWFAVATCLWHVSPDAPQGRGYNARRIARSRIGILTLDPFHFGVHAARLLHLLHGSVRSQFSFSASLQLTMKPLVVSVQLGEQTFGQDRSGQTLSDHQWIVAQRGKHFAQHTGLFGVTGDSLHFGLQLVRSDRPLPVILQRLRVAQIIFDLFLDLRLRHHLIQWRLGAGIRFRPDAMPPVNFLDRPLICDAICKRQRSVPSDRRRGHGRGALVSTHAEGGVILRSWKLRRMVR
jgi:hypothetical protein